jgi:hypothetical protein
MSYDEVCSQSIWEFNHHLAHLVLTSERKAKAAKDASKGK